MGLFIFILLTIATYLTLKFWNFNTGLSARDLYLGWTIKIGYSLLFVVVFSHYYGNGKISGDSYNFIHDSKVLNTYAGQQPLNYLAILFGAEPDDSELSQTILGETHIWSYGDNGDFINDNRLIIRINSVIHFISGGNSYVHALLMAWLSFLGILLIYKTFSRYIENKRLLFIALLVLPSIGFWSSGITKESILFLALGLFFYSLFQILEKGRLVSIPALFISVVILLFNKPHVGLIIIGMTPFLLAGVLSSWNKYLRLSIPLILFLFSTALTYAPEKINLLTKVSYKQRDLINMGKGGIFFVTDSSFCAFDYELLNQFEFNDSNQVKSLKKASGTYKLFGEPRFYPFEINPGETYYDIYLVQPPSASYIDVIPIEYSRGNMLKSIPFNLINTTIRPYPWDPGSGLKYFSFISNLLILSLFIFALYKRKKMNQKEAFLFWFLIYSAIVILLLIGWTTPILGAIVRYKTAAELLLVIAAFIIMKNLKKTTS